MFGKEEPFGSGFVRQGVEERLVWDRLGSECCWD